jgi:hypothetical protein
VSGFRRAKGVNDHTRMKRKAGAWIRALALAREELGIKEFLAPRAALNENPTESEILANKLYKRAVELKATLPKEVVIEKDSTTDNVEPIMNEVVEVVSMEVC